MKTTPLVTVLLISYNHVDSFEKAIQSVLCQKTTFPFQIIILDDASTDGTSEIAQRYAQIENVECIIREKNIGGTLNIYEGLKLVNTKYFAMLETDDYWCDENKLQMQVDILEHNPDCSFCGHNTRVDYVDSGKSRNYFDLPTKIFNFPKKIRQKYYITPHTSSRLYRTECLCLSEITDPLVITYDIGINFYYITKGNLYYIDKIMSVYNYTTSGIYSGIPSYKQRFNSANAMYRVNKEFHFKYNYLLAKYFSMRLCLNWFEYFQIKYNRNPIQLDKLYKKILKSYEDKYLNSREKKSLLQINLPLGKKRSLVFEIRREKERA